jgi:hypothetical protein
MIMLDICKTRRETSIHAAVHRECQGEKRGSSTETGGHMATKKIPEVKSKTEKSAKKLQVKDLTGKELDKQVIERVKGGLRVICYSARAKSMPW